MPLIVTHSRHTLWPLAPQLTEQWLIAKDSPSAAAVVGYSGDMLPLMFLELSTNVHKSSPNE